MPSRYNEKNMPFCAFFHVQPKHPNGNIFVDIEGFRPYLSKPSYRAPNWALMVRLIQKERLKSPYKSLIIENQAALVIFVILGFWPKQPFCHFGQPFPNQGGRAEKKFHLGPCLHQRDQATFEFSGVYTHRKPGKIFYCRGCVLPTQPQPCYSRVASAMEGTALLSPHLGRHPAPTRPLVGWCRFKPIATLKEL